MPTRNAFEYAIIRVVPRIERGEAINVGVVVLCRAARFLDARFLRNTERLRVFAPQLDLEQIEQQFADMLRICQGGAHAGPLGELPVYERFRWLTAPRSTIIQASPVHCGLCADPATALEHLTHQLVD